jgi:restriction system protein
VWAWRLRWTTGRHSKRGVAGRAGRERNAVGRAGGVLRRAGKMARLGRGLPPRFASSERPLRDRPRSGGHRREIAEIAGSCSRPGRSDHVGEHAWTRARLAPPAPVCSLRADLRRLLGVCAGVARSACSDPHRAGNVSDAMPVPTYDRFIDPLLRYLASRAEGARTAEAADAVAKALGLSEEDKAELIPDGIQPLYRNRNGWAHDRLKRSGLSASRKRGFWQLTEAGISFVKAHPKALTENEIERITNSFKTTPKLSDKPFGASQASSLLPMPTPAMAHDAHSVATTQSPDDRIEAALDELRDSTARDLLELIAESPPAFFEKLVLDLLHAMGYGTTREDVQQVGGSGDGGIDGIISLDRLGLEKVYVQAKRWKNVVGRPDIQGFYGALAGKRANKGVFITTSSYTKEAREFATQVEKIVLVDGSRLAGLMIDHGVGVTHHLIKVPKIDNEYFPDA